MEPAAAGEGSGGAGNAAGNAAARRFLPAVASRRKPAAAQRAVAHSTLHPLLQIAKQQDVRPTGKAAAAATAGAAEAASVASGGQA